MQNNIWRNFSVSGHSVGDLWGYQESSMPKPLPETRMGIVGLSHEHEIWLPNEP
jgi:hypothetical protein